MAEEGSEKGEGDIKYKGKRGRIFDQKINELLHQIKVLYIIMIEGKTKLAKLQTVYIYIYIYIDYSKRARTSD